MKQFGLLFFVVIGGMVLASGCLGGGSQESSTTTHTYTQNLSNMHPYPGYWFPVGIYLDPKRVDVVNIIHVTKLVIKNESNWTYVYLYLEGAYTAKGDDPYVYHIAYINYIRNESSYDGYTTEILILFNRSRYGYTHVVLYVSALNKTDVGNVGPVYVKKVVVNLSRSDFTWFNEYYLYGDVVVKGYYKFWKFSFPASSNSYVETSYIRLNGQIVKTRLVVWIWKGDYLRYIKPNGSVFVIYLKKPLQ